MAHDGPPLYLVAVRSSTAARLVHTAGQWSGSRCDQNEPQHPPQLPLGPESASARPSHPAEHQKPRLLFECNAHTLASERHFHTMLRRRQIDDYSMRVAHGPRPWSIAYGRVGFSSDVDTIEIRQVRSEERRVGYESTTRW